MFPCAIDHSLAVTHLRLSKVAGVASWDFVVRCLICWQDDFQIMHSMYLPAWFYLGPVSSHAPRGWSLTFESVLTMLAQDVIVTSHFPKDLL